jgi:hypothetical protein
MLLREVPPYELAHTKNGGYAVFLLFDLPRRNPLRIVRFRSGDFELALDPETLWSLAPEPESAAVFVV